MKATNAAYPTTHQVSARGGAWIRKGRIFPRSKWQPLRGSQVSDDLEAHRTFVFKCPVLTMTQVFTERDSYIAVCLVGYPGLTLPLDLVAIIPEADDVTDSPIAVVRFTGYGPRNGPFQNRIVNQLTLRFRDKDQLERTFERIKLVPVAASEEAGADSETREDVPP